MLSFFRPPPVPFRRLSYKPRQSRFPLVAAALLFLTTAAGGASAQSILPTSLVCPDGANGKMTYIISSADGMQSNFTQKYSDGHPSSIDMTLTHGGVQLPVASVDLVALTDSAHAGDAPQAAAVAVDIGLTWSKTLNVIYREICLGDPGYRGAYLAGLHRNRQQLGLE